MPKVAYSEIDRNKIKEDLIETGLELFSKQGIQHTTVEQIYTRVLAFQEPSFTPFSRQKKIWLYRPFIVSSPKSWHMRKS